MLKPQKEILELYIQNKFPDVYRRLKVTLEALQNIASDESLSEGVSITFKASHAELTKQSKDVLDRPTEIPHKTTVDIIVALLKQYGYIVEVFNNYDREEKGYLISIRII